MNVLQVSSSLICQITKQSTLKAGLDINSWLVSSIKFLLNQTKTTIRKGLKTNLIQPNLT